MRYTCRSNQQNLNIIRMIISNAMSFYSKWRCFVNKLLVNDTKRVCRGQRFHFNYKLPSSASFDVRAWPRKPRLANFTTDSTERRSVSGSFSRDVSADSSKSAGWKLSRSRGKLCRGPGARDESVLNGASRAERGCLARAIFVDTGTYRESVKPRLEERERVRYTLVDNSPNFAHGWGLPADVYRCYSHR